MPSSPNIQQAIPFFWVKDMGKSLAFYQKALGFELVEKWEDKGKLRWCKLDLGNASLMLQEFWKGGHHANLPERKLGEGVCIYFMCEDAIEFYESVKEKIIFPQEPYVGNAMWVLSLEDPDGYKISFESPSELKEGTTYRELL